MQAQIRENQQVSEDVGQYTDSLTLGSVVGSTEAESS